MSSHREAPETSKDPVADNTDVYAFRSPDAPDTITLIANFIPFQIPQGGPNFAEFGDNVLYAIHISNRGDAQSDVRYEFRFTTKVVTPGSFLYNTGPISSLTDPNWSRRQTYQVVRITRSGKREVIADHLACPPVNVGIRSTPHYDRLAAAAVHKIHGGRKVFAGQRADGFFVDLGSIFDLGALRPFNEAHLIKEHATLGINGTQDLNVHSIAIQVPISDLTRSGHGNPDASSSDAVIGVWATASRRSSRTFNQRTGKFDEYGPYRQVSRLANPLINEVINPVSQKDFWNSQPPQYDKRYVDNYAHPQLAGLLPVLYPGVFPNLDNYNKSGKSRADLQAILLTGIPSGVVPGFQNYTGSTPADLLRLNVAVKPTKNPNPIGLIAGDAAGFPNGRRVFDNVTAIELRAIAGATIPLVDSSYTPDKAAGALTDGTKNTNSKYLSSFPYLGLPAGGYESKPGTPKVA